MYLQDAEALRRLPWHKTKENNQPKVNLTAQAPRLRSHLGWGLAPALLVHRLPGHQRLGRHTPQVSMDTGRHAGGSKRERGSSTWKWDLRPRSLTLTHNQGAVSYSQKRGSEDPVEGGQCAAPGARCTTSLAGS